MRTTDTAEAPARSWAGVQFVAIIVDPLLGLLAQIVSREDLATLDNLVLVKPAVGRPMGNDLPEPDFDQGLFVAHFKPRVIGASRDILGALDAEIDIEPANFVIGLARDREGAEEVEVGPSIEAGRLPANWINKCQRIFMRREWPGHQSMGLFQPFSLAHRNVVVALLAHAATQVC